MRGFLVVSAVIFAVVFGENANTSTSTVSTEPLRRIKPRRFQIDLPSVLLSDPYDGSRPKRQFSQFSQYPTYQQPPYTYQNVAQQPQYFVAQPAPYRPPPPRQIPRQQYQQRPNIVSQQYVRAPAPAPVVPRIQPRPFIPPPQVIVTPPHARIPPAYLTTPPIRHLVTNAPPRHIGYVTNTHPPKYIEPVVVTEEPWVAEISSTTPEYIAPRVTVTNPPYIAPIVTTTPEYIAPRVTVTNPPYIAPIVTTTPEYIAPRVTVTNPPYIAPRVTNPPRIETTTTEYVEEVITTTPYIAPTTTTTTTTSTPPPTTSRSFPSAAPPVTTQNIVQTTTTQQTWIPEDPSPADPYFPAEAVHTPKFDESFVGQYYYGKRGEGNTTFPLPSCFYNPSGYVCCSLMLNELMTASFEETRKGKQSKCNVQKIANALQKHSEKIFDTQFETVVSYEDFSQKIHFKRDLVCKIEVEGRFILAYATPESVEAQKIIPTVPSQNIVKDDSIGLKEQLRKRIQESEEIRSIVSN